MRLSRTFLLAASLLIALGAGCATGGYSGVYTSATVFSGPPVYGYPGWPGYYGYGPPYFYRGYGFGPYPGPYFGVPHRYPRFSHPGHRVIPPQFRSGPRWGGPRHFRR
jgi:hypothetical protein